MISSPVSSLMQDTNFAVSTVQKKFNVSDTTADFGKHFDKASQNVNNSCGNSEGSVNKKEFSQKTTEEDSVDTEEKTNVKDDFEEKGDFSKEKISDDEITKDDAMVSKEEVGNDELSKEVAEALTQIIEQIKSILGISDEELNNAMEIIGIQTLDLFDSNNMPELIMAITGAESNISFVTDEDMYTSLQEVLQIVEQGVNSLMEDTGLTNEELDKLFQEIKSFEDTNTNEVIEVFDDNVVIEEENIVNTENVNSTKKTVIVSENNETSNIEIKDDEISDSVKIDNISSKDKDEKRDFGQQNNFANNFENNQNGITKLASESNIVTYTSESTERIMKQIVDMVKVIKTEQLTEMELQLHPASLGNVKVSLATKGGVVTAEFITQNEAVKNAIEAQAVQLKANLEEQGVKIEAIEVSVASHEMERNLEQDNKDSSQSEREQDEKYVQGIRKNNINFNSFEDGDELLSEMNNADDATRIAMEMMAMNGNSMDIMA